MAWKTNKRGELYKEVKIEAELNTPEYSEEMFAELQKAGEEIMEVLDVEEEDV